MKKILLAMFVGVQFVGLIGMVSAQKEDDPLVLIPEAKTEYGEKVNDLGKKVVNGPDFFDTYNDHAEGLKDDVGAQIGSGIMDWNTILTLLERIVKFIANAALIVGSAMVIYAGYLYVASVFSGDHTGKANDAIKWAVIGIVVVIFSYAILRFVIQAFL